MWMRYLAVSDRRSHMGLFRGTCTPCPEPWTVCAALPCGRVFSYLHNMEASLDEKGKSTVDQEGSPPPTSALRALVRWEECQNSWTEEIEFFGDFSLPQVRSQHLECCYWIHWSAFSSALRCVCLLYLIVSVTGLCHSGLAHWLLAKYRILFIERLEYTNIANFT